jgi:signal peptidase I
VNKLAYGLRVPFTEWWLMQWAAPRRGELVVCYSPRGGTRLVKRLVGLPGDRLELRDHRLFVNGQPADYEPLDARLTERVVAGWQPKHHLVAERLGDSPHPVMVRLPFSDRRSFGPVTVPPDHYFVLGDNRDNSRDSRYFGFVPRDSIIGRASSVVLSFDPDRHYRPRWDRFFHALQ